MKNLAYKTIFGKEYTHAESLKSSIIALVTDIIRDENNISEKDFSRYDVAIKNAKEIVTDDVFVKINEMYNNGKRLNYIAESIYDEYGTQLELNEGVILDYTKFTSLK